MAKKKTVKIKESIGLDIGSHSIKAVHLKKTGSGWKLLGQEIRQTMPAGIEYVPSDLSSNRFAPILAEMLKSMKINPKKVKHLVSSIGGDNVSIKQIKTIFLPEEELESALFFEAKKHIPISGGEMLLDYQVLNVEENTNNMNILLVATTKQMIQEHSDILTAVNLAPGIVDVEALAVANSFAFNSPIEEGIFIILNIGAHKTNMVIYSQKSKFFARDIGWGGYNFTKDIMESKDLEFEAAEKYKFEHGISKSGSNSTGTISMLDITEKTTEEQIALEVKRSLRFYVKDASSSDFRKILLVGGGAKLKGLREYINEQLSIPTEIFNPFVDLEMSSKQEGDPQFALALGLAMRPE